jgi:hypothetical protein
LVFPHTSEVWKLDPALTYAPAEGALTEATASCGFVELDDVRPTPADGDRYWEARGALNAALAAARYPLTRLAFRTVFGAGHVTTLVLAPSREALDAAPPVKDVIGRVLGEARAAALLDAIDHAAEKRETLPLVVRHDLTWRPPSS